MLTDERRELRRKTIGASDAPVITGISPFGSVFDTWLEKAGIEVREETQSTRLGSYLQHGVAQEALHWIGGSIIAEEPFAVHADGWASATPDYIIRQDDSNAILEIKTTHESQWDVIPERFLLQVNWQSWVHGIDRCYLAVLHGSLKVEVYEITPTLQSAWFVSAVKKCKDFYDRFMVGDEQPVQPDAAESESLASAIRAESGKSVDLDEETIEWLGKLARLKRSAGPVSKEIEALEKLVKDKMATAEIGLCQGKTLVTWKGQSSDSFDSKRFKAEHPQLAKQYTKTTDSRRFLPKEDAIMSVMKEAEHVVN